MNTVDVRLNSKGPEKISAPHLLVVSYLLSRPVPSSRCIAARGTPQVG
jgi:hypothetical protein